MSVAKPVIVKNNSQNLLSADCRPTVGPQAADSWATVYQPQFCFVSQTWKTCRTREERTQTKETNYSFRALVAALLYRGI